MRLRHAAAIAIALSTARCGAPPGPSAPPTTAAAIEVCADAREDVRPAGPGATCEGRPRELALRRYRRGDAVLGAGFVPHAARVVAGEPLFVTFVLRNDGPRPVTFKRESYETDTTRRPDRFRLVAIDAGGTPLPDADPSGQIDNLSRGPVTLPPGHAYVADLVLSDWVLLDRPGQYTVTATRLEMGWDTTETGALVESTFPIEVLSADAARLGAVIDALGAEARASARELRGSDRALRALLAIPDPRAVPYLEQALAGADATLVLAGLPRFNTPERRRLVITTLSAPGPSTRESAAEALGRMPAEESVRALVLALRDGSPQVRSAAFQALLATGAPFQTAWTLALVTGEELYRDYGTAATVLLARAPAEARPILATWLDFDDPSPRNAKNCAVAAAIASQGGLDVRYVCHDGKGAAPELTANRRALDALREWLGARR